MAADLNAIQAAITADLPDDQERIRHGRMNLDYYRGHFRHHRYRIADDPESRNNRNSLIMKKSVDSLTSFLYRDDPVRVIPGHSKASDFLQRTYKYNSIWAKMQAADRLTMIGAGGAVAFQIAGTDDLNNPIKIHLWADHSFAVFVSDDDPLLVEAVVTIDCVGKKDRWTLWTPDTIEVYTRDNVQDSKEITRISVEENPYGVLPFAFAHFETPVLEFWSGSPGNVLREVNDYAIYRLTELADGIKNLIFPKYFVEGVNATWKPPRNFKPGDYCPLPQIVDAEGNKITPKLVAVTAPLGFVAESWTDLGNYIEHSMEMVGVPQVAYRMNMSAGRSGESIAQEQAPLVNYARGRQRPWLQYETNIARVVLQVAIAHLDNHGEDTGDLQKALDDFQLSVRWSPYYSAIPGPERDRADEYSVTHGYASRIQVLQEREGMTHEEAIARLKRVAVDLEIEDKILPIAAPSTPQDATAEVTPVADSGDSQDMETEGNN